MIFDKSLRPGIWMEAMKEPEMIDKLKVYCKINSMKTVAEALEISPQYLSDILRGKRAFPESIANKMGYEKSVIYINWGGG
jgi:transcriptional regulator with XRE-family HTH domain